MTESAHPLIRHRHRHLVREARLSPREIRHAAKAVTGFNAKVAVVVPAVLGSMPFFWFCCVLAVCSLPAVTVAFNTEVLSGALPLSWVPTIITRVSLIALVAWLAQTFIQLVALPILQVSGNATQAQAEAHVAVVLDRLDTDTEGGVQTVLAEVRKVGVSLADLHDQLLHHVIHNGGQAEPERQPPAAG